jgi:hypothetical protein
MTTTAAVRLITGAGRHAIPMATITLFAGMLVRTEWPARFAACTLRAGWGLLRALSTADVYEDVPLCIHNDVTTHPE